MAELPYMPLCIADFLQDTQNLDQGETGAYLSLLIAAWTMPGCVLPDDDERLARLAKTDLRTWKKQRAIIQRCWIVAEGVWTNKRQQKEKINAIRKASIARANGRLGGRPKSQVKRNG